MTVVIWKFPIELVMLNFLFLLFDKSFVWDEIKEMQNDSIITQFANNKKKIVPEITVWHHTMHAFLMLSKSTQYLFEFLKQAVTRRRGIVPNINFISPTNVEGCFKHF